MQTTRKTKLLVVVLALAMVFSTVAFAGNKTYRKTSLSYTMQPDFLNVSAPFSIGYGTDTGFHEGKHSEYLAYTAAVNFTPFAAGEYTVDSTRLFCCYNDGDGHPFPFLIGCANYNKFSTIRFKAPVTGTYNFSMGVETWSGAYVRLIAAKLNAAGNDTENFPYDQTLDFTPGDNKSSTVSIDSVYMKAGEFLSLIFIDADERNISAGVKSAVRFFNLNVTGTSEAYYGGYDLTAYGKTASASFGALELGYGLYSWQDNAPLANANNSVVNYKPYASVGTIGKCESVPAEGDTVKDVFYLENGVLTLDAGKTASNMIKFTAPYTGTFDFSISVYADNKVTDMVFYRKNVGGNASTIFDFYENRMALNTEGSGPDKPIVKGLTNLQMNAGDAIIILFQVMGDGDWAGFDKVHIKDLRFTDTNALPIASDMFATVSADGGYYTADKEDTTYGAATKGALALTVKFDPAVIGDCADITAMGVYVFESGKGMTDHSATVTAAELMDNGNEGYYRILITDVTPEQFNKIAVAVPYVLYGEGDNAVPVTGTAVTAKVSDYAANWLGVGTLPA